MVNSINGKGTSSGNLEDLSLEVFLAVAAEHDGTVRDYVDQIKANSKTRQDLRILKQHVAAMKALETQYGGAGPLQPLDGNATPEDKQKWATAFSAVMEFVNGNPQIGEAYAGKDIWHMSCERMEQIATDLMDNLGDINQEAQQRMSKAVNDAARHYELGSSILKKYNEVSSAIIRNI
jgi:hypothetical protein